MEDPVGGENYEEAKRRAKEFYKKIGCVFCPALNDFITFNSAGFRHLVWQGKTLRREKEQMRRFALLSDVKNILNDFNGNKEYRTTKQILRTDRHGKKIRTEIRIQFWGLIREIDGKRIKVIVRQVGNGRKHFFSIF